MSTSSLESLVYTRGSLRVLDQLKIPYEATYIDVLNSEDAWSTIRTMQVRGAPLIAIVAVLGLAVEAHHHAPFASVDEAATFLTERMTYLRTSRPTAVNLFTATDELTGLVKSLSQTQETKTISAEGLILAYIAAAEEILAADVRTNVAIGDHGAEKILELTGVDKVRVLTICNTGSLATAGYGTALGVVRSLHKLGKLEHIYACETRPYNQGARLTAFEIVHDGLPGTLITDSMASALIAVKGVDVVIVGADRVAANGDTANKIGTYQLAITAKYHGIPFFTAAPTTTLDVTMASGAQIHVEERPAVELTSIFNQKIAPDGINVWNPAFDVTPCNLITGVITELGVAQAASDAGSDGIIDLGAFLRLKGAPESKLANAVTPTAIPPGYRKLDETSVVEYVLNLPKLKALLLPDGDTSSVTAAEVGDGNLNNVFILSSKNAKIVVKQALPYVRCVGESWPLTLQRATFERNALTEERKLCPERVPEIYHFNERMAIIVMRFIEPPHLILRKFLIDRVRISTFASHLATFAAHTLFKSSALALDGGSFRLKVSQWSTNTSMCALTEAVIFTEPYSESAHNHWTTPQLDNFALAIKRDVPLKVAVAELKAKFLSSTQALIHGDLHTGSVMAAEGSTFVIDSEFAFYGPMGFDLGAILANLLLNYFSHAYKVGEAEAISYAEWVLQQAIKVYNEFSEQFVQLWNDQYTSGVNEVFRQQSFLEPEAVAAAQKLFMSQLWRDTLGFAGCKMLRRVVGIAHVADLESITDLDARAACERRVLALSRRLILQSQLGEAQLAITNVETLAEEARQLFARNVPGDVWPPVFA